MKICYSFLWSLAYKEYKTFRAKAFQFLNHVDDYIDEFKTLMVEKFQIIYA